MELDDDTCYRAVQARDARFDGRFFTAVSTTGIYCRPICPARTPFRKNVRFYRCAAAAEEAGFRPCLRCRPESAPGSPAWQGASTTVIRALRLIQDGFLDTHTTGELAERVGMGERHLRRLFQEHLGVAPAAMARSRRVHFAHMLLRETALPVSAVAESAGFSSLRRFNDAFKTVFACAPSDVRRAPGHRAQASTVAMALTYRKPFAWETLLEFFARRAIPGVEDVVDGVYRRALAFDGARGVVAIGHDPKREAIVVEIPPALCAHASAIAARARRVCDLHADPGEISACLSRDRALRPAVKRIPGLRVPGAWEPFEIAVRAVLGQQVSVEAARTLAGRLAREAGDPLPSSQGAITHTFPGPEAVARSPLTTVGMPQKRKAALRNMAERTAAGALNLVDGADVEAFKEALVALPGFGPWTAEYIAMRGLGDPDAFPAGDLGVRRALAVDGAMPTERAVRERAEAWRPWRAYAALYVWNSL